MKLKLYDFLEKAIAWIEELGVGTKEDAIEVAHEAVMSFREWYKDHSVYAVILLNEKATAEKLLAGDESILPHRNYKAVKLAVVPANVKNLSLQQEAEERLSKHSDSRRSNQIMRLINDKNAGRFNGFVKFVNGEIPKLERN